MNTDDTTDDTQPQYPRGQWFRERMRDRMREMRRGRHGERGYPEFGHGGEHHHKHFDRGHGPGAGRWFGPGERGGPPAGFGPHGGRGPGSRGGFGGRGPGGPGGRGDGPWGRRGGPKVARGDVRGATLLLLAERPMHGYQIIQEIAERSHNVWKPSPGSVYPALQLLEDEGLIRAEQSEERRVFHLTDAGRTYVEAHRAELSQAFQSVTADVDDTTLQLRDLLGQVATAVQQVAQVGTPTQLSAAQTLLTNARRQLYRILADDATTGE